jgi:hypothetical protein
MGKNRFRYLTARDKSRKILLTIRIIENVKTKTTIHNVSRTFVSKIIKANSRLYYIIDFRKKILIHMVNLCQFLLARFAGSS